MSSRLPFFATRNDLLPVLSRFEKDEAIQFVLFGHHRSRSPQPFSSLAQLKDLGMAEADSAISCASYLVLPAGEPIAARDLGGLPFTARFAFDQLINPDSVVFSHGGVFAPQLLIHGSFGTASDSAAAKRLMRRARSALQAEFKKVKSFHVGPEALTALRNGARLTASAQASREYDLVE